MMSPAVIRAFSEAYGSWNTICTRRRNFSRSLPRKRERIDAVEGDGARVGSLEHHQRPCQRGLSAAGLPDQAERLTAGQIEVDAVEGAESVVAPCRHGAPGTSCVRSRTSSSFCCDQTLTTSSGKWQAALRPGPTSRRVGPRGAAHLAGQWAARLVDAALGIDVQFRRRAADRLQFLAADDVDRHRVQQALGVGMLRVGENLCHRAGFDDVAGVHDRDPVRLLGDQREVVGDQHHRHVVLGAQAAQQRHDLRLHRDVQRGGGFVGDQHAGIQRHRHRDQEALPHAAGELVRVGVQPGLGLRDADARHQFDGLALGFLGLHALVDPERLGELGTDGVERVERGERVLEHDRQLGARQLAPLLAVGGEQVDAGQLAPSRRRPRRPVRAGPTSAVAVIDLPHPDSPSSARVSPRRAWNDTSLTARTVPRDGADVDGQAVDLEGTGRRRRRSSAGM